MSPNHVHSRSSPASYTSYICAALALSSYASVTAVAGELPFIQDSAVDGSEPDIVPKDYAPTFGTFDRSIAGRASSGSTPLENNQPQATNLQPGSIACYMIEKSKFFPRSKSNSRDLDSRTDEEGSDTSDSEDSRKIYLTGNTCLQPRSKQADQPTAQPPQLTLYIFDSADGGCGRKLGDVPEENKRRFEEGAFMFPLSGGKDVYVGIAASEVDETKFDDRAYNFEIAASADTWYHEYVPTDSSELLWMDSDSTSALLVTRNLTMHPRQFQAMMEEEPPYMLFAENEARNLTGGLRASYCGLKNSAQILANAKGDGMQHQLCQTTMTTRGPGGLPKQQFFFQNLNYSSSYTGILFKPPGTGSAQKRQENGPESGGGVIFPAISFQTADSNSKTCQLMEGSEFEFCEDIQWGIPGNDDLNKTELAKKYDDYARKIYSNFEKAMMQISCEAPADQAYSLARNCDDCRKAYKKWLCTVAVPRCEGIFSNNTFAIARNLMQPFPNGTKLSEEVQLSLGKGIESQGARNAQLNNEIKPGPYKEILPCEDLCYEVVQSCPAALGLACPQPGMIGFAGSYGRRAEDGSTDPLRCNSPGVSRTRQSLANTLSTSRSLLGLLPLGALALTL